ncbi:AP-5 complex subunit beta-1 [Abrus precatorius]|uniref:AP-5 complex subunit beta-1 n=1 Tax=Abrus precatorius TaxID=3816 RepID=A0A8B8LKI7_ABRPR|nr:AP-5 complex subunit beta-1 [Abrus precatorius]
MAEKAAAPPPSKPLTAQEWETLIEEFQSGTQKWCFLDPLLDLLLSSLLRKDFTLSLKLQLLLFLDEFSLCFFPQPTLHRLIDALKSVLHAPVDAVHITPAFKDQFMVSVTSILICVSENAEVEAQTESVVELLLTVINRPNFGSDRHTRGIACECLRELELWKPGLLSDVVGHLWSLCQNERTHASQNYLLLFTSVIHNIITRKLSVSVLNTSVQMVPFNVPQCVKQDSDSDPGAGAGLNMKELRRALAFLLEWPQVMTPCAMMEFMCMIIPMAMALELQPSMLKVQLFGMIYSYDPILCHVVVSMYLHFLDAFDGQEGEVSRRLLMISRETQHNLVFRLLAVHWLLGFNQLIFGKRVEKTKPTLEACSTFYPALFDPLALKALKLDLLAFCFYCVHVLRLKSDSDSLIDPVKLFEDGLVCVSSFKWLPPGSTEIAVAFRTFHKFLIAPSSHSDNDPSTTRNLLDSMIFRTLQGLLVNMMLENRRLVPVVVAFVDRLLSCQKHSWLGECLLQKFDEHLLPKVRMDYKLVYCFPMFDRIAKNQTIPPRGLLELLTNFMIFLVEKHGPDTGMKSWSQGSRALGICRTMMMHHHSSRLFLRLSRLLAFTCLYFPDLEVRDNSRIYLRMLVCIPGKKLRDILNLEDMILGISPSSHPTSFFNVQSPRPSQKFKTFKNLSSCIHLERLTPLLVKQFWSLSLSNLVISNNKPAYLEGIRDPDAPVEEKEFSDSSNTQIILETARINQPKQPLRVMDSKVTEILNTLRKYFSCIPDFRHMPGLKVRISCSLRFESNTFNRMSGIDNTATSSEEIDALPAIYATVLNFSSSAPYGPIPSYRIPFLLGEPHSKDHASQNVSLSIVPVGVGNDSREEEKYRATVVIDLEPREPTPGIVDVHIETNAENGQIIQGQLQGITVGIEDMFLKAIVPSDIPEDEMPRYNFDLFTTLWEACGSSSNTGRETFQLKGGKGIAAISGTQSVKLLDVPATSLIQATECHLARFVVGVSGEPLIDAVWEWGIIQNVIWEDASPDATSVTKHDTGPLRLTYNDEKYETGAISNSRKRSLGCFHVLIFLPPRFHLLFQMEVGDVSTLVRIRTDHWPSLAYIDDYLEALYLS